MRSDAKMEISVKHWQVVNVGLVERLEMQIFVVIFYLRSLALGYRGGINQSMQFYDNLAVNFPVVGGKNPFGN